MGSADKSRSPKVEHFSVLVKALKCPPSQLFPGTWIAISFYFYVSTHFFYNVGIHGVYEVFAFKQIRHNFNFSALDLKFRVVLVTFVEE